MHEFKTHYKELRVKGDRARGFFKMIQDIQRRFHRSETENCYSQRSEETRASPLQKFHSEQALEESEVFVDERVLSIDR